MSDEPAELPPHDLAKAKLKLGVQDEADLMRVVNVGETVLVK